MAGMICAVIVNILQAVFHGKGQKPKPMSPLDFMPEWGKNDVISTPDAPAKAQTVDEMAAVLKQLAATSRPRKRKRENGK
jgi:hypothetical protein